MWIHALAAVLAFQLIETLAQQGCATIYVSREDFDCAGFSRDTLVELTEAITTDDYGFCTKQEIAMFFGQAKHEGGLDPTRQVEFCVEQGTCDINEFNICSWNPSVRPATGKHYRGRGPIQLSYSCNYKLAGDALGTDLLSNPDRMLTDDALSWGTALWFWNLESSGTSAHEAALDMNFGDITRQINGALECDGGPLAGHQLQRAAHYRDIAHCMGLQPSDTNLFCTPELTLEDLPPLNLQTSGSPDGMDTTPPEPSGAPPPQGPGADSPSHATQLNSAIFLSIVILFRVLM
ncbi:hypothetical protein BSKO_03570 [Bryopsis sp. KO-2023]|nr:hypothetical protein BSKO_03570 [Bryopsis sp. KO-2023]